MFLLRRNTFLGTREKRTFSWITGPIFYGEIKLVSYVLEIMFMFMFNDYVYVNRQTFVWVLNYMSVSLKKSTFEIEIKFFVVFCFFN